MNEKAKCSGEDKKRQALLTQHLSLCHNDKIFFWSFTAPEVTLFLQTVKLCCQNVPSLSPTKNKIKLGLLYYYIK